MDTPRDEYEEMRKAIDLALRIGFDLQAKVDQAHTIAKELIEWHEREEYLSREDTPLEEKFRPLGELVFAVNKAKELYELTKPVSMRTAEPEPSPSPLPPPKRET